MKFLQMLVSSILVAALQPAARGSDADNPLPKAVAMYAKMLGEEIDARQWDLQVGADSIVIQSRFKVRFQRRVSPALGEPPDMREYRVELRFRPSLPKDEYLKLAKERMEPIAALRYGTKTKDEWHKAWKFLQEHPLPKYEAVDTVGHGYSVYVTSLDSMIYTISPAKSYAEVKGVEALIDHVFFGPLAN